ALRLQIDMTDIEPISTADCLRIDVAAPNHHDLVNTVSAGHVPGSSKCRIEVMAYRHAIRSIIRLPRDHDMRASRQRPGKGLELLAPHDHRFAHGGLLEPGEIGWDVPGNRLVGPDDAVAGDGGNEGGLGHSRGITRPCIEGKTASTQRGASARRAWSMKSSNCSPATAMSKPRSASTVSIGAHTDTTSAVKTRTVT